MIMYIIMRVGLSLDHVYEYMVPCHYLSQGAVVVVVEGGRNVLADFGLKITRRGVLQTRPLCPPPFQKSAFTILIVQEVVGL
jgi:hypothetical protein